MRRVPALFICLLLLPVFLPAQESLLWKVTPAGSNISAYILFTTELPGVENYQIAGASAAVMNDVNTVAFYNVPDQAELANILTYMKSPGESTLKGFYKREDRIRFELMVNDKLHTPVDDYYTLKPLYVKQLFRDVDHANGKEFQTTILLDEALNNRKPTLSMLTLRQIASVMEDMDFATQAAVLSNYVNNADAFIATDIKKFAAYARQDLTGYAALQYAQEDPNELRMLLNGLNELLIKKMEVINQQGAALYIMDADFAAGDYGILNKLKVKGYTVSPVAFTFQPVSAANPNDVTNDVPVDPAVYTPDNFPSIAVTAANGMANDPNDIVITNIHDMQSDGRRFTAFTDPFGDHYDPLTADTLFLEYWFDLKGTDANFKVRVPVKGDWEKTETPWITGGTIKNFIYQNNDAKSDLFYSVGYTIYPPNFEQNNKDNFFDQFIEKTGEQLNGKIMDQRIISTPDFTGREFTAVVGDTFFVRSKFLLQDNILYQLLVGGPGNNPYSEFAEAFMHSFKTGSSTLVNWYMLQQPQFSCTIPTPPSKSTKTYTLPSGPLTVQTFTSEDYKNSVTYAVSVSAYPPGHKFGNKKKFFEDLIDKAERDLIGRAQSIEKVERNGVEGRYLVMQLMNQKTYRILILFDGNTVYQFAAGGDGAILLSNSVNKFFDSVTFVE
ncbi:MAG: TraB/GumN family protein [Chitinophagales bacterium]